MASRVESRGEDEVADQLPPLPADYEDMRGPTPTSNWVIPGKLIAGAYPGSPHPAKHSETIRSLVLSGEEIKRCFVLREPAHKKREILESFCVRISTQGLRGLYV